MKNLLKKIVKNKKLLALIIIIAVILVIAGLYGTFASNSTVVGSADTYTITLTDETNTLIVPANSSKTVIYQVTNTNKGTVNYGVGYSGDNITVKVYSDSQDGQTGQFDYGDTKFIKLRVTNSANVSNEATITSVLGYENGGDLIVPSDVTLVTETYSIPIIASSKITKLFSKTGTVTENPTGGTNAVTLDVDTNHQLIKDKAGNIRYYGTGITNTGGTYKEPNNYIDIGDNVLWRIIGVFNGIDTCNDDACSTTTKKDLIKVIRSTYITSDNNKTVFSWDTSANTTNSGRGINEWSQADLMKLLNPGYDSNQDLNSSGTTITVNNSLWYNSQSGTCYNNSSNATTSCNFTNSGLSETVKNKIADVTWNTGGWNDSSVYPNQIYTYERGTTVVVPRTTCSGIYCNDTVTRTTSWTGKIGLAYPSDYGYATDLQECNKYLNNYSNTGTNSTYPCRGNNWMWYTMTGATTASSSGSKRPWLLTPYSSYAYIAWYAGESGSVNSNGGVSEAYAVSPVLYLNSEQVIESGSGTSSDPYVLS